jgi:hypothetical protein
MRTAYHEAGHAVVAVVLGGRVLSLTIAPDRDDGPARYGDTQVLWPKNRDQPLRLPKKLVLTALAGPVAEMIYTGEPLHPGFVPEWANDWQAAFEAAAVFRRDERKRVAWLEQQVRWLHAQIDQHYWPAVAAVADELSAHDTLDTEQFSAAVEPWL